MARRKGEASEGPRLIKRYGNRRLYDTREHRTITREELAELARAHVEFVVLDARTGEDLTHTTLLALLTEGTLAASATMPIDFLKKVAGMQRDAARDFFEVQLPRALDTYLRFGEEAGRQLESALGLGKPVRDPGTSGERAGPRKTEEERPSSVRKPRKR